MKLNEIKDAMKKSDYNFWDLPEEDSILYERYLNLLEHKGKVVRHFKGNLYIIIDIAINTENKDDLVIYKALYDDCKVYARPIDMFLSEVEEGKRIVGGQKYRFEFITLANKIKVNK